MNRPAISGREHGNTANTESACGCEAATGASGEVEDAVGHLWQVRDIQFGLASGVLLLAGFVSGLLGWEVAELVLSVAALLVGASTFVPGALKRLARGKVGVGLLMTIGAVGATALGQIEEAAMLAFLFSLAEGLEDYSLAKTRRGLRALLGLVPREATIRRGGRDVVLRPDDLVVGDLMIVKPGERVATDGDIRAGRTSVDTSAITGESMPVEVGPGDPVFAGSINGSGVLEVEVTAAARDNSLARIVHIVEAEQSRKGDTQRLADRIAKPLVPGILIAAAVTVVAGFLLGEPAVWLQRALVMVVAASPCALAISVPVTAVASIGAASRRGILVKGGAALESLGEVRTIALDKTGTLTRNQPAVIDVASTDGHSRTEVLSWAAALEARSEHPLARAILAAADDVRAADEVTAEVGSGLTGRLGGRGLRLGRPGWIDPGPLTAHVTRMQDAGATAVVVELDGAPVGAIAVRDELRPEAPEVIAQLRADGYTIVMLTGDNEATARAIAREAGISEVYADLRPEDKSAIIQRLRRTGLTAMVGDGVNDAPALATADLGIAMGAMGTDVAIETADVALMGDDLRLLPHALDHARRTRRIMLQNMTLSIALIGILIPLGLFGILGLAAVVLIHEVAEVFVIGNGIRAGRTTALPPITTPALQTEQEMVPA
ncbi:MULTISPECIES: heavy metal translocating P-type ATPase [Tessaracoccus]|uniref:heavy metal translocating P-type ATPase n=1 Tax=Tessaracoccus TaxID=72763 RepID=UPI00099B9939|nr:MULTISPECIES: cation-translocating P-type ATPase [Tessaracoccus]AQX14983.1 cadmium-translocating P-type ATPase [Tessaracoccus sp. T2.5-30]VEP39159.1 putative cation-transporting ATPase G [Tessaracoccus lapidicaptus]